MSFPVSIDKNAPATTDTPLPTQISQIGGWLQDLFGLPNATNILGAILGLGTLTDGKVATDTVVKASTPFKRLIGTEGSAKDFRLVESAGLLLLQVNTATEAAPTWVTVYSFNFGANFAAQLTHTLTADRAITIPDFAGTLALFSAVGSFLAKFSQANTADRTYTFPDKSGTVALIADAVVYTDELTGLGVSNNGTDPTNDLDIALGAAASDDAAIVDRVLMSLTAALTKQIDATWAVGTNTGMRDSADNLTGAKTFYIYVFRRAAGAIDIFASTSLTPTLPDGGDKKRRIRIVRWTGTTIAGDIQEGDYIRLKTPILILDNVAQTANTWTTRSLFDSLGIRVIAHVRLTDTAGGRTWAIRPSDASDPATVSAVAAPLAVANSTAALAFDGLSLTNASGQIDTNVSTGANFYLVLVGWYDRRGRG